MAPAKTRAAAVVATKQMLAPAAALNNALLPTMARKGLTRRTTQNIQDQNAAGAGGDIMQTRGKRKAEHSPSHGNKNEKIKRSALGNLTNNVKALTMQDDQQLVKKAFGQTAAAQVLKDTQNTAAGAAARQNNNNQNKITTRATARNASNNFQQQQHTQAKTNLLDEQTSKLLAHAAAAAAAVKVKREDVPPPAAPVASAAAQTKMPATHKPMRRISNEFKTETEEENSLYMSALEDVSTSESMLRLSGNFEAAKRRSTLLQQQLDKKLKTEDDAEQKPLLLKLAGAMATSKAGGKFSEQFAVPVPSVPYGVDDFDKANWNDPFQISHYAAEIFQYLKQREDDFPIRDYMQSQIHLSKGMRSLLVDWMVEVQETFELNHETLYLAVKIVDLYLCEVIINKERLQLLGAAALFIACKYDERTPPLIEDFLYICDGAYQHDELIRMEMNALRTIDYDLGIPLSYRFLRRYARCAKIQMPTLTLARFILELSLMDYATIRFSDSQMAAAALFMALRMHGDSKPWTPTLEHYSGYALAEFAAIVPVLNAGLNRKTKNGGTVKTIRSKYSHKIFHEVAKVPLKTNEQLFENSLDLKSCAKMELDENEKKTNSAKISAGATSGAVNIATNA